MASAWDRSPKEAKILSHMVLIALKGAMALKGMSVARSHVVRRPSFHRSLAPIPHALPACSVRSRSRVRSIVPLLCTRSAQLFLSHFRTFVGTFAPSPVHYSLSRLFANAKVPILNNEVVEVPQGASSRPAPSSSSMSYPRVLLLPVTASISSSSSTRKERVNSLRHRYHSSSPTPPLPPPSCLTPTSPY